jgi:glycerol-3-phosphate acyltransferase PlsX
MRIVLDAMGSDAHPQPELEAALRAFADWGDPVILTGPRPLLERQLQGMAADLSQVELVDAPEVLEMTDKPASAARGKAMNSMAVGMDLVKGGQAQAFVTAGNTGGAMANALFRLGRIRGVKRPPLAGTVPVRGGQAIVLDIGANADCRPEYLVQFAILGSVYASKVLGIEKPRVALLSNGEEAGKGSTLVKETFGMLENARVNFIGNVEPKELFGGMADVVVTDGFTGNILIKGSEAVASFLIEIIREQIKASAVTSVGGLLAKPAFRRVAKVLDPAEYGAAPLLGIDGLVFVGHGRSDAHALVSALRVARQAVQERLLEATAGAIRARLAGLPAGDE